MVGMDVLNRCYFVNFSNSTQTIGALFGLFVVCSEMLTLIANESQ